MIIITTPELIKLRRQAMGLTQRKLGEMCGYEGRSAETVVSSWEHDSQPVPIYKLRVLAKSLDITIDDLVP